MIELPRRLARFPRRTSEARAQVAANPLLAAWRHFQEPYSMFNQFRSRDAIATSFETWPGWRSHAARRKAVKRWAFAVPNEAALHTIARYTPLVQIGAGTGYWAHLLRRDYGVDILPFDSNPPRLRTNKWGLRREFVPILDGHPTDLKRYPDRALFLCWPPMSDMAARCLRFYQGVHVLYIGEGPGGCTADDAFFKRLDRTWDEVESVAIPQWDGIHDELTIYRRR